MKQVRIHSIEPESGLARRCAAIALVAVLSAPLALGGGMKDGSNDGNSSPPGDSALGEAIGSLPIVETEPALPFSFGGAQGAAVLPAKPLFFVAGSIDDFTAALVDASGDGFVTVWLGTEPDEPEVLVAFHGDVQVELTASAFGPGGLVAGVWVGYEYAPGMAIFGHGGATSSPEPLWRAGPIFAPIDELAAAGILEHGAGLALHGAGGLLSMFHLSELGGVLTVSTAID